jgi:hypothetical protein
MGYVVPFMNGKGETGKLVLAQMEARDAYVGALREKARR